MSSPTASSTRPGLASERQAARRRGDPRAGPARTSFISSTLDELAVERLAVSRAVSALRLTPVLFGCARREHHRRGIAPRPPGEHDGIGQLGAVVGGAHVDSFP
jgi:hypothetical protein